MVLRIETTSLARGREFALYAFASFDPEAVLHAYNPVSGDVVRLDCWHGRVGALHRFEAVAPEFDGYLLAEVGTQAVVKKIGYPVPPKFVAGYRRGYTLHYKAYGIDGGVMAEGPMASLVEPFFACDIPDGAVMMETLGKKILIQRAVNRMAFRVEMAGGALDSSFDGASLGIVGLPEVALPDAELGDVTLSATLPEIRIEEL